MTKKEYLDSLSGRLGTMPYNDVKEIIADIDAHFEDGIAAGKSEADIAKALGDPRDLAIAYMDGNEKIISNALRKAAAEHAGKKVADNRDNNALRKL